MRNYFFRDMRFRYGLTNKIKLEVEAVTCLVEMKSELTKRFEKKSLTNNFRVLSRFLAFEENYIYSS